VLLHGPAATLWVVAWLVTFFPRARRTSVVFAVEHSALLVAIVTGAAVMSARGWGIGHARWLAVKLLLVFALFVPLEGFHAYICHVFLPRARRLAGPYGCRQVERGRGLEAMIRTIAIPLFGLAAPLVFWLSTKKPF
jgi:hypothetical protein